MIARRIGDAPWVSQGTAKYPFESTAGGRLTVGMQSIDIVCTFQGARVRYSAACFDHGGSSQRRLVEFIDDEGHRRTVELICDFQT